MQDFQNYEGQAGGTACGSQERPTAAPRSQASQAQLPINIGKGNKGNKSNISKTMTGRRGAASRLASRLAGRLAGQLAGWLASRLAGFPLPPPLPPPSLPPSPARTINQHPRSTGMYHQQACTINRHVPHTGMDIEISEAL